MLLLADALDLSRTLPPASVDLLYIDPPFFTGETRTGSQGRFGDSWGGSIEAYLQFLGERLRALWPLLSPKGSLLLHLDWHAVHHAKVMCDRDFGARSFQGELVWAYNSGGGSKRRYGRKHDTLLWYSPAREPYFDTDAARVPYSATIAKKREHLFHGSGKVSGDVFFIPRPPNHAKEWTGWPTQKPLALLEWLVRIHAPPGGLVADPMCGSGTSLVAAHRLGRRWVGADISSAALDLARRRLLAVGAPEEEARVIPSTGTQTP